MHALEAMDSQIYGNGWSVTVAAFERLVTFGTHNDRKLS